MFAVRFCGCFYGLGVGGCCVVFWFGLGFFVFLKAISCFTVVVHRSKIILSAIQHLAWDTKACSNELLFKSVSLAMILDTVIFRLNKIWRRTLFLASQTHHMYTLIQLTEAGEVRTRMKMKNGQDL